jgi:hypothetical protein
LSTKEPPAPDWLVRIELQRIQTFLFAVPRLRAMLGANALLGDTLRHQLPQLLGQRGMSCPFDPQAPPDLAAAPDDPLAQATGASQTSDPPPQDDPTACWQRGILARDGGHFAVAFGGPDKQQAKARAEAFVADAHRLLADALPGLKVGIRLQQWSADAAAQDAAPESAAATQAGHDGIEQPPVAAQLPMLPQFQVCTQSGFGPAADTEAPRADGEPVEHPSAASRNKIEAGKRFQSDDNAYHDVVSLLRSQLPGYPDSEGYGSLRCGKPKDLADLSDNGGYIALIHADGNRIGERLANYRNGYPGRWRKEVQTEHFFHRMRVIVRTAVLDALRRVFPNDVLRAHRGCIPYQLLMLGGDDLLLICRPDFALPFVQAYAQALADSPPLADGAPLSIGAGVVIAKHTLPFHRLHALAEELAGSAKRLYLRAAPPTTPPNARRSIGPSSPPAGATTSASSAPATRWSGTPWTPTTPPHRRPSR